jgi:hypothetical protein
MKRIAHLMLIIIALVAAIPALAQPTPIVTPLAPITATLEVKGLIESFTANTVTVGGQTYAFTPDVLEDDARLLAGAPVEIKLVQRSGEWVVTEVDDEETPVGETADGELKGILESVDGMTIVVSGVTLDISSAVIADALVVGNPVEVYVMTDANGVWLAMRIEDNVGDDLDDDFDDDDNDGIDDRDDDDEQDDDRGDDRDDDDDNDGRGGDDDSNDDRNDSNSGNSDDDDSSNSGSGNSDDHDQSDDHDGDDNDNNDDDENGGDDGDDDGGGDDDNDD